MGKFEKHHLVAEYLRDGENFNITGDMSNPLYLHEYSDERLIHEYNLTLSIDNLFWKEDWLFIFNHAIMNRRKNKIKKILNNVQRTKTH